MIYQVIGVHPSQGEFRPSGSDSSIRYNNVNIFVADLVSPCTVGHQTSKLKMKAEQFAKLVPTGMNSLVGQNINVGYNQWGNIERIDIIKKNG